MSILNSLLGALSVLGGVTKKERPRILLLADKPGWALDAQAKEFVKTVGDLYDFRIEYVRENPDLSKIDFDLLFVLFWGEFYQDQFKVPYYKVIKQLSSHRWENEKQYGFLTPQKTNQKYFRDCGYVTAMSLILKHKFDGIREVYHLPQNIDTDSYRNYRRRSGKLKLGWVGNSNDLCKGLHDILEPAIGDKYDFRKADGTLSHKELIDLYNEVDVILVASTAEGGPFPLMEAMSCGCFPVCVNVGIVPELVENGKNGLIVERTPEAFRKAFKWCELNLDKIREIGATNSELISQKRSRKALRKTFIDFFDQIYSLSTKPRFRNDDVSFDTDIVKFKEFCDLFHKYGYTQIHGVTLRGVTNPKYTFNNTPVEYKGHDSIVNLSNEEIKKLSFGQDIEANKILIEFLNSSKDEIALHGLYHTDYSKMSEDAQREDIKLGLEIMNRAFPNKLIRYFIAPFNRTNLSLYKVCEEFGLEVLEAQGIHLEEGLDVIKILPNTWYRYHHHRFYSDSSFTYYDLSLEKLEECFKRSIPTITS